MKKAKNAMKSGFFESGKAKQAFLVSKTAALTALAGVVGASAAVG